MSILSNIERIEAAKQAQYTLIQEFGGTVASTDRIDAYADIFRAMLESGTVVGTETYYKCQSVDPETKTWAGFEAIDRGTYFSFADVATTGLSYIGYAPVADSVYSADGRVKIAELFNGITVSETGEASVYLAKGTTVSGTAITTAAGSVTEGVYTL